MNSQKNYEKEQKKKRIQFIFKWGSVFMMVSLFVFLFGYDTLMYDTHKLLEFFPPFFFLFFIIIFIGVKKYRIFKICPQCGIEIKNKKRDCVKGNIELIDTVEKLEYQNISSTIKGKTVYPHGGYAMQNSELDYTSETIYEVNQKVPVVQKYNVYQISYRCKNCGKIIFTEEFESLKKRK